MKIVFSLVSFIFAFIYCIIDPISYISFNCQHFLLLLLARCCALAFTVTGHLYLSIVLVNLLALWFRTGCSAVPPRWIVEPVDANVERNRHIMLHCQAQGVPTPSIVWKKATGMRERGTRKNWLFRKSHNFKIK